MIFILEFLSFNTPLHVVKLCVLTNIIQLYLQPVHSCATCPCTEVFFFLKMAEINVLGEFSSVIALKLAMLVS